MSESQEQQNETGAPKEAVAPKKIKREPRREEPKLGDLPIGAKTEAPVAENASVELKVAAEERPAPEPVEAPPRRRSLPPYVAQAAGLILALGLGWASGWATVATSRPAADPAQEALLRVDWKGFASGLQKNQTDTIRIAADVQALKGSLNGLKDAVERMKQDLAGRVAQVGERLDRTLKTEQDITIKLAGISERLDRPEKGDRDLAPKLTQILERLDKIERQGAAQAAQAATPKPAAQPAVASDAGLRTGSLPEPKAQPQPQSQPEAKPAPIEGWVLREVYDGMALIEGRDQRLREVAPGQTLPGVGRVEAIERRGRSWVVVTNKGIITSQQW